MPKTFEDKPMYPLPIEAVTVGEWCPNPDRENPTQVHLIIRFKGTKSMDKIINGLIKSRRRVFPDAPKIGETE